MSKKPVSRSPRRAVAADAPSSRTASAPLPSRPDPDQLRRQAKDLLARLRERDPKAAAAFREHLPEARGLTAAQVLAAGYRLADAQSVVARRSGFANWPALARHVETLRGLEGEWSFAALEVDGEVVPPEALRASRILIDGDRFRTESADATYDGEFLIDVEASPVTIDVRFVEGPEAGRKSLGLLRLDGDTLTICLGLAGAERPRRFATAPGGRSALETLRRTSRARPEGVTGGRRGKTESPAAEPRPAAPVAAFEGPPGVLAGELAGEWKAVELVRDGKPLPAAWLASARRVAEGDELRVIVGGRTTLHARVRYVDGTSPAHVDYLSLAGETAGQVTHGIAAHEGGELRVNMAPAGAPRPADWSCEPGSGRTFSRWRRGPR